ncbi:MAG: tetratricopeptide repeat protein [Tepidisphaeraceae bacterium]
MSRSSLDQASLLVLSLAAATVTLTAGGCATAPNAPKVAIERPQGIDSYVTGVRALNAGDEDSAIAGLRKAIAQNPNLRMAQKTLGELYMKRQQYADALPYLQRASELDPYTVSNHYNLGLSLQILHRLPESIESYLRGLKIEPDDFKSNMNLGLVYFALNQLDPAVIYLERSTRIDAKNPRGWSNLGVVHDARGNNVLAEACYRRSLELEPDSEPTLLNLTSNLITQKKSTDAVDVAKQLVARKPDSAQAQKRLGDALTLAKDWDGALKAYDTSFGFDKNYLPAINGKADMYLARYRAELQLDESLRELAIATWKQSLALNDKQPTVAEAVKKWSTASVDRH